MEGQNVNQQSGGIIITNTMSAAMDFFNRDSRMSLKQPK